MNIISWTHNYSKQSYWNVYTGCSQKFLIISLVCRWQVFQNSVTKILAQNDLPLKYVPYVTVYAKTVPIGTTILPVPLACCGVLLSTNRLSG